MYYSYGISGYLPLCFIVYPFGVAKMSYGPSFVAILIYRINNVVALFALISVVEKVYLNT